MGGGRAGVELVLTAGEENGCEGALALPAAGVLGNAGALVVAEPTAGAPVIAHKGLLWLHATTRGRSAHASTPALGRNAISMMAEALRRLDSVRVVADAHPLLGPPTLNVGEIAGGSRINSVPDACTVAIDVRTVPGMTSEAVLALFAQVLGPEVELRVARDLPPVATAADDPWIRDFCRVLAGVLPDRSGVAGAEYVTDACVLKPAYGDVPTVICGPGDAAQAHTTDEWCSVDLLRALEEAYFEVVCNWCHERGGARA